MILNKLTSERFIATRLREVREAKSLSQRSLAMRANISNATISLIQAKKISPSVAVLERILGGIPMDLSQFFADEPSLAPRPVFYPSTDLVEIAGGPVSFPQVGRHIAGRRIQILHERMPSGTPASAATFHALVPTAT